MLLAIPKALAKIVLAMTIILAGLMVCIHIPQVTEIVSRLTSNAASVGLSSDAMAKISVSTRDFSLGLIGPEGLKSVLATLGRLHMGVQSNDRPVQSIRNCIIGACSARTNNRSKKRAFETSVAIFNSCNPNSCCFWNMDYRWF